MKRLGIALIALNLAGCATTAGGAGGPTAAWLVGTWLEIGPDLVFPLACASGLPIRYERDGRYVLFEEDGSWHLDGERLTETALVAHEGTDPAEVQIGRPIVSRVERTGADAFRKVLADGSAETFRRCPGRR